MRGRFQIIKLCQLSLKVNLRKNWESERAALANITLLTIYLKREAEEKFRGKEKENSDKRKTSFRTFCIFLSFLFILSIQKNFNICWAFSISFAIYLFATFENAYICTLTPSIQFQFLIESKLVLVCDYRSSFCFPIDKTSTV